jgi:predicted RNA-binding protein with PUA domain
VTMDNRNCTRCESAGESCTTCSSGGVPIYWCESCRKAVEEKRCPLCGLKAKKVRQVLKKP